MSITYNNSHSITFILKKDGYDYIRINGLDYLSCNDYKLSWYDFGLVPIKRPSLATPQPNLRLVSVPGANRFLDLTDSYPGGLTFGRRSGQWDFYLDTDTFDNTISIKTEIERFLDNSEFYCILEDDHSKMYKGRIYVSGFQRESSYPKLTIAYDLHYLPETNRFRYDRIPIIESFTAIKSVDLLPDVYVGNKKRKLVYSVKGLVKYRNGKKKEVSDIDIPGTFISSGLQNVIANYNGYSSSIPVMVYESSREQDIDYVYDKSIYLFSLLGYYDWNLFDLENGDIDEQSRDEAYSHVIKNPAAGSNYSSKTVTIKMVDTSVSSYTYEIVIYDFAVRNESDIVQIFNKGFSLVDLGDLYDGSIGKRYRLVTNRIVRSNVQSIQIVYDDSHIIYVGDQKDSIREYLSGTATCADGTTYNVKPYDINPIQGFFSESGSNQITINYYGFTEVITLNVLDIELVEIQANLDSNYNVYEGDTIDSIIPHIIVSGISDRGTSIVIDNSEVTFSASSNVVKYVSNYDINVSYEGFSTVVYTEPILSTSDTMIYYSGNLPTIYVGDRVSKLYDYISIRLTYSDDTTKTVSFDDVYLYNEWSCNPFLKVESGYALYLGVLYHGTDEIFRNTRPLYLDVLSPDYVWDEVDSAIRNGTYRQKYHVGDEFPIVFSSEWYYGSYAQIVGIDKDVDENGNKIPITWITKDVSSNTYQMNDGSEPTNYGGYLSSSLRATVNNMISLMPSKLQSMIVPARKITYQHNPEVKNLESIETIWIPSITEMFGNSTRWEIGSISYEDLFVDNASRCKRTRSPSSDQTAFSYWLRTSNDASNGMFLTITGTTGRLSRYDSNFNHAAVAIGFCTGASNRSS